MCFIDGSHDVGKKDKGQKYCTISKIHTWSCVNEFPYLSLWYEYVY